MLAHKRAIRFVEATVPAIVPVDGLEDDLPFPGPVEDERRARTMFGRAHEYRARGRAWQETPHQGLPLMRLHDRPVTEDERERRWQALENRPRELVAAPGRNRYLDASVDRAGDGGAVRVGNLSVAVEDGAVEVEGEQADHFRNRGSGIRGPGIGAQSKLTLN